MAASPETGTRTDDVIDEIIDALRLADTASAKAARLLGTVAGGIALRRGLPSEVLVRLAARRTRTDTSRLFAVVDLMRAMPVTASLVESGVVSFSQAIMIAGSIGVLDAAGRARVDALIGKRAPTLIAAEPERLVWEVDDLVVRLRDDLLQRREQRALDRNVLALQPRIEGGGTLYGHADAESFATLAEALDAAAARPAAEDQDDDEGEDSRAEQRMEALVGICESWLAGGSDGAVSASSPPVGAASAGSLPVGAASAGSRLAARPRPRFLVSFDLADQLGVNQAARILPRLAGQPIRLSRLATETMLCDAQVQIVGFENGRPVAISDTSPTIPAKSRAAVIARDGGCRFPGCGAPAGWSDAHHVIPRGRGGSNRVDNLIMLCRRCHRRVHKRGWGVRFLEDGTAEFRHRGRTWTSQPRARAPALM